MTGVYDTLKYKQHLHFLRGYIQPYLNTDTVVGLSTSASAAGEKDVLFERLRNFGSFVQVSKTSPVRLMTWNMITPAQRAAGFAETAGSYNPGWHPFS